MTELSDADIAAIAVQEAGRLPAFSGVERAVVLHELDPTGDALLRIRLVGQRKVGSRAVAESWLQLLPLLRQALARRGEERSPHLSVDLR